MSTQLALFEASTPPRLSAMPDSVERMWQRAKSPEVEMETLAIAASRPNEWLSWEDFRAVIKKHDIGGCFGHIMFAMVRAGKLREQKIYLGKGIGAERPGSGNYQGFYCKWSAA